MLNHLRRSLLRLSLVSLAPLLVTGNARLAFAQGPAQPTEQPPLASPTEAPATTITICRYDPESGVPNVLGMRTYVSLTESDGNTVVTLDRFPTFVTSPESPNRRADVSEVRSLTLYDTPIATARQLLIDQPAYYMALMDIEASQVGEGFAPINETLGCGQVAVDASPVEPSQEPAEEGEEETTENPEPEGATEVSQASDIDLPNLPNGNYRFVSAAFPNRVVSEAELTESGGAIFLFRKFGENITGTFRYTGQESNVCIAGTVDGNTVVGTAYRRGSEFESGAFLTLGEETAEAEYAESVLNMQSFSRINAGSRLPLESCS